jgi:hypothetical protein
MKALPEVDFSEIEFEGVRHCFPQPLPRWCLELNCAKELTQPVSCFSTDDASAADEDRS